LDQVTEGDILIDGRLVNAFSPKDRNISMVFQNYALYPHMTVFDNMAFGLRLRGYSVGEIDARVHEAAAMLGVAPLLGRKPLELSGGQRQRVALARALAIEPRMLLLDEPFGALDAKVRKELRGWLRALHERLGLTTIFVTHDQEEAFAVADLVAIMNAGKIEQYGAPEDVRRAPKSQFVSEFLDSAQANAFN
jgi:ABC-type sugar transport system ATPase subunit